MFVTVGRRHLMRADPGSQLAIRVRPPYFSQYLLCTLYIQLARCRLVASSFAYFSSLSTLEFHLPSASCATMPEGTVEVELIKAHDLKDVEAIGKSDPFGILSCGHVQHRSRAVPDGGSNPVWNQSFLFEIPDGVPELSVQLFDLERHGRDKPMGIAIIPLAQVYAQRQIAPTKYKVQLPNGHFHGEVEIRLKFFPKVHHGALDLHLVKGHGLLSADVFDKSDPYAFITCHKQNLKSRVIENGGSDPHWDQTFVFTIDSEVTEVMIRLFDRDTFTADDPLGTAIIPLHKAFAEGYVPPMEYKVLGRMGQPQGEVTVGLKFTPKL